MGQPCDYDSAARRAGGFDRLRGLLVVRARPWATEVNSLPERIFSAPKRVSKMRRTAGTNDDPPVRKTASTSSLCAPERASRESTQVSIRSSSSSIQLSKTERSSGDSMSTYPSENLKVAVGL